MNIELKITERVKIMARPTSFKASDIINAANELSRTGKNINGTSLRKLVGAGRPDALMTMYNELLAEGKISTVEETKDVAEVVEIRELPQEVEQSLDDAVTALKNVVMQCNDIAHNTVEGRLNAAIEKAKAEEILAAEEVEKAQIDLGAAYDEIEQLRDEHQAEIESLNDKLAKRDQENSELKLELSSTKQALDDSQKSNTDLSSKLEAKTTQCVTAEQDAIVQKTRAEEMAKQLAAAQETNAELTKSLDAEKALKADEHGKAEAAEAKLTVALEAKQEAKQEAKEAIAALKANEAELHQQLEERAAKIAEIQLQTKEDAKTIKVLKEAEASLKKQLESSENQQDR
ncbi:TPA: hypothetical protein ACQYCS_004630 [Vibrio parahaemolyticus]